MKLTYAQARAAYAALQLIGGADETGRLRYPLPPAAHGRVLALLRALRGPVEDADAITQAVVAEHRDPDRPRVGTDVPIRDALAYRQAVREALGATVDVQAEPLRPDVLGDAATRIPPAVLAELGSLYEPGEE